MDTTTTRYCIYIDTLAERTVPLVRDDDDNPCVFATQVDAEREIADNMMTRLREFMDGARDFEDAMTVEEYVVEVVLRDGAGGLGAVRDQMIASHEAAWSATSPRLLELCRVRIAMLLGCEAEVAARTTGSGVDSNLMSAVSSWPSDPRFDALDRACLAFTEQFVIDVASIDDDTVAAMHEYLTGDGVHNFVNALLVVEQRIRLRLIWDRLFGGS